jgi:HD-like signal output (HDOD) protein
MSLDIEQSVLKTLPKMQKQVTSLLDALKQDFVVPKSLEAKLIACPVISGRVLQIANSSFYGLSREISSLREATIILGQHTLRSLVYSLAAMDEFKESKQVETEGALNYKMIWQHSLYSACLARVFADYKKLNASDIFTAALFEHFGILILETIESEKIKQAMNLTLETKQPFKSTIQKLTELNYISLSAKALNYWHFPVSVCELIQSVKDDISSSECSDETKIILLANTIASVFLSSPLSHGYSFISKQALDVVESKKDLIRLLEQADILYSQMASNFIG